MRRLSLVAVCLVVVFAGCTGGGGAAADATTATPTADTGGSSGGSGGDAGSGGGSSGSDVPTDAVPVLKAGEHYEYDVGSDMLADAYESGTLTIDVTSDGEWPDVGMKVAREAPSGRVESASAQAAAFSPAMAEMSPTLTVRSLVVNSRLVAGKSTAITTYDVGQTWTFDSSNGEVRFEVVGEDTVAGVPAKHVHVGGEADSELDADIWLAPGVGFPVKFVQTDGGETVVELTLTSYEGP